MPPDRGAGVIGFRRRGAGVLAPVNRGPGGEIREKLGLVGQPIVANGGRVSSS